MRNSFLVSQFDCLGDVDESVAHALLDRVVHGRVPGQNQPLEHRWLVQWVAQSLLVQIRGPAAHGLDQALGGTQIPVMQAG